MVNNNLSCWLKYISNSTSITELSIPGSHDAMTALCDSPHYKTQYLSLDEQLNIGVRFFDLRITRNLVAAHRKWISDIEAKTIFDQLRQFLIQFPSEFIIVRLQNANEKKDDFEQYKLAIQTFITGYLDDIYTPKLNPDKNMPSYDWPTIGEVRGKIIVIECAPTSLKVSSLNNQNWAYNWHENENIVLQDNWNGPDIDEKLKDIKTLLNPLLNYDNKLILNHISATNGNLADPIAYAEIINPIIANKLKKMERSSGKGVLIYDFIDDELAINTIKVNVFNNVYIA